MGCVGIDVGVRIIHVLLSMSETVCFVAAGFAEWWGFVRVDIRRWKIGVGGASCVMTGGLRHLSIGVRTSVMREGGVLIKSHYIVGYINAVASSVRIIIIDG